MRESIYYNNDDELQPLKNKTRVVFRDWVRSSVKASLAHRYGKFTMPWMQ